MNICCTVLLGPGSEAHVGEAIASARGQVDSFLFIESGGSHAAVMAASEVAAGMPCRVMPFCWLGDYGSARQFALDQARQIGADWALTLDPDERLHFPDGWRALLEQHPEAEVVLGRCKHDGYFKERILRCKSDLAWVGRVCEFMTGMTVPQLKIGLTFDEVPKTPEAERRRWERGVVECQKMIEAGDDRYRWRRHLGSCLMGLGRREEAILQYQAALPLASTPEETAWIRYLLTEQLVLDERFDDAARDATIGLSEHAGFLPEFGWILAYCEFKRGRLQNASRWAQLSLQVPEDKTRVGFRSRQAKAGCRNILGHIHQGEAKRDGAFTLEQFQKRKVFGPNYKRVAHALCQVLAPKSHLDLGAGQGLLVEAMRDQGVESYGIELSTDAREATPEAIRDCMTFGAGIEDWRRVDRQELVSSVEVLEHLPETDADRAVGAICGQSIRWVYFSAAAPEQTGSGHINCQPKSYWRKKFESRGFRFAEAETGALVASIKDLQPCTWLPKNAMIFERTLHGC